MISRTTKTGQVFMVAVEVVDGQRIAVATLDGKEIGRGPGQVGLKLSPAAAKQFGVSHVAGVFGRTVVGMTAAECDQLGKALYAKEIAQAMAERHHDALYNEGHRDGFNPTAG